MEINTIEADDLHEPNLTFRVSINIDEMNARCLMDFGDSSVIYGRD